MFPFRRLPADPPLAPCRALSDAVKAVEMPAADVQDAIKRRVMGRIQPLPLLAARDQVQPEASVRQALRSRITSRIADPVTGGFWTKVQSLLTPSADMQALVKGRLFLRLQPAPVLSVSSRFIRWSAAFTVALLLVRLTPLVFLAPVSRANSPVLIIPNGDVSVLLGGIWQPLHEEMNVEQALSVRTGVGGSATLILHDDGVVRLDVQTTVAFIDINDRPDVSLHEDTFVVESGRVWAQALIPETVAPGWVIGVPSGTVLLNEGSVSVAVSDGGKTQVQVWDRLARMHGISRVSLLTAGQEADFKGNGIAKVKSIRSAQEDAWVATNLGRDAVHRKEVAVLQQKLRAQHAGILPTSPIYPVKRVAEAVDVLLTFNPEAKVQKILDHANTRLDEAAALLQTDNGSGAVAQSLQEYRQTLLSVATGSGTDGVVHSLVAEQLSNDAADVAAALPGDDSYLLKKTVLETTAAVPESTIKPADVQGALLVDTLSSLTLQVQQGQATAATDAFRAILPSLSLTNGNSDISTQVRKEARAALTAFADALVQERDAGSGVVITRDIARYLPGVGTTPQIPVVRLMTDEEIDALVAAMYDRIYFFTQPRSRYNQLLTEFHSIEGIPDRGRILRKLYHALPENGLAPYVRTEIQKLREEVKGEGL